MRLFIHIGSDKCGSTAIQESIFNNRNKLLQLGVYVPESGLGVSNGHAYCFKDGPSEEFHHLIEELHQASREYKTGIISWEGIHFKTKDELATGFSKLQGFDAQAIYYVRDQAEIIQSGVLQQWKTGGRNIPPFDRHFPDSRMYFGKAEMWSNFLGKKTLVALFDRNEFEGGDICKDFYRRVGLKDLSTLEFKSENSNKSLSFEAAYILSKLDRIFKPEKELRKRLVKNLLSNQKSFQQSKYFLKQEDVKAIRAYYSHDNAELEKHYGVNVVGQTKCWINPMEEHSLNKDFLAITMASFEMDIKPISGWFNKEKWGTWAKGDQSTFEIIIPKELRSKETLNICLHGRYFVRTKSESNLIVNNEVYHGVDLSEFSFPVSPSSINENGAVLVQVQNLHRTSPKDHGIGEDVRKLSYGLEGVSASY